MFTTEGNSKKSNRRVALRVYEKINLFYHKVNENQLGNAKSDFGSLLNSGLVPKSNGGSSLELSFPLSQSQENDTLNVNISASGIAFTCREELKAGDYLMLRILFLSSLTVVMTCCKVVYCKPSNPYESNRHPYTIGAQFINMAPADSELLARHVGNIKKQQLVANGSLIALTLGILAAPGEALHLVLELGHHLFEEVLHVLHLVFELLEMALDHVIEHHFHTDTHATQVIVFYILASIGLVALYFICRKAYAGTKNLSNYLLLYGSRKKSSCLYFWGQQTYLDKIKIIGLGTTALVGYLYFGI